MNDHERSLWSHTRESSLMGTDERLSLDDRYTLDDVLDRFVAFVTAGL